MIPNTSYLNNEESFLDINAGKVNGVASNDFKKVAPPQTKDTLVNMMQMKSALNPNPDINNFMDFVQDFNKGFSYFEPSETINNSSVTFDRIGVSGLDPNFDEAVEIILESEGYLSNHVDDRGGYTIYGISERANPQEVAFMKTLDQDEQKQYAIQIYKEKYWDSVDGIENMDRNSALVAFDAAVNHGVGYANKMVLETGGEVNQMLTHRLDKYAAIIANNPSQQVFQKGWENRISNLKNDLQQTVQTPTIASINTEMINSVNDGINSIKDMLGIETNQPTISQPSFNSMTLG